MLAAIQSVDPPSLILWSLLVFAAGMYPVGLMLGSTCSPCCGTPCTQCIQGTLPDTVTVTFSGFPNQTSTNIKTCCGDYYNGMTVVLRRDITLFPCQYRHSLCGLQFPGGTVGSSDADQLATIALSYRGPTLPPLLTLSDGGFVDCSATLTATQNVTDCSDFTFSLTNASGITAQVVPGGTYDAAFLMPGGHACYICCRGEEPFASQAEFTIQDNRGSGTNISGTYVLPFRQPRNQNLRGWESQFVVGGTLFSLTVELRPCQTQTQNQGWLPGFCETCHNKCYFQAVINFGAAGNYINEGWFALLRSTAEFCASECQETPICNPYGRTWVLCRNAGGSNPAADCGDIVVTA